MTESSVLSVLTPELLAECDEATGTYKTARTLPPAVYTSDEFLAFEREAVFSHEWLCLGRSSRVPNPGDWFTVTIVDEPLIVVRGKDGVVRVLSAVCQHRGMQVVEGCGNNTTFRCPYHHWIYGLDGRLLGTPAMERTEDFDKKDFPLPALAVEEWHGFVFCHFDPDPPPLAPTLARIEPHVAHWDLDATVAMPTFTLHDLPWNWKVMFENFNDGYHANRLHEFIQDFCPSHMAAFPEPWDDASNVVFRHNGFEHIDGGFNATHKALLPIFPNLTEEDRWRATFALIPPTLCLGLAPDQAFYFLVRPLTANSIDVEIGYLFPPESLEHPMFEHLVAASDAGVQVFVRQDQDATTKVQRGLRSRFAARGRYSWQEETHVELNRWLVQRYHRHWPSNGSS
jgi:phenylpropionate dioxygenase-like ring-hydroxylating dioxygenase large terminal subunit